jgi:hypothetical protein
MTYVNGIEFVATDAPMEEFLAPGVSIEVPFVTRLHKRHGEWPILIAYEQKCPSSRLWIQGNTFLFPSLRSKVESPLAVLRVFAGENDVVAIRSENPFENAYVEFLCRINQCIGCLLRSVEGPGTCHN